MRIPKLGLEPRSPACEAGVMTTILHQTQKMMFRKAKRDFFSSIKIKKDAKSFWHACKPFMASKPINNKERIMLIENDVVITDDNKVADVFNNYFTYITKTLDIPSWRHHDIYVNDPIIYAISKYRYHPSIMSIKRSSPKTKFTFSHVSSETVYKYIIDRKKGSVDTPLKILKPNADIITPFLTSCINSSLENNCFPEELKLADIIPIHKKGDSNDKSNYRPISILPTISKVFEKVIFDQINIFFKDKFSKFLCGFRKGFSTQHTLMRLLQKWQKCLDNKGIIGTILMDLSKAYDCINYDILLAKLEAYGFSYNSLAFLYSYLKNRKQRTKIGSVFSKWLEVVLGIPQGSILGPLLFNIFLNDLFEFVLDTGICNFADDNTIYACDTSLEAVISPSKS